MSLADLFSSAGYVLAKLFRNHHLTI